MLEGIPVENLDETLGVIPEGSPCAIPTECQEKSLLGIQEEFSRDFLEASAGIAPKETPVQISEGIPEPEGTLIFISEGTPVIIRRSRLIKLLASECLEISKQTLNAHLDSTYLVT